MQRIVDSCQIIASAESGTLREYFQDIFKNRIKVYIDNSVLKEIKSKLDEDSRILFETLYNEGALRKLVITSQKKYRLEKKFKDLIFRLESTKEFHLSRTDMILIALSAQTGAYIDTTDSGISDALAKLKIMNSPWKKYFIRSPIQERTTEQLEFDFDIE